VEEIQSAITKVAKGSTYLILDYAVITILGYLFWVITAKMISPEEVGLASTAVALINIFIVFATLSIPIATAKYIAEHNAKGEIATAHLIHKQSLKLVLITSLITAIILIAISKPLATGIYNNVALIPLLTIIAITIPFQATLNTLNGSYQGCQKMQYCILCDSTTRIVKFIAVIILLLLGLGALGVTLSFTIGFATATMLGLFILTPKALPKKSEVPDDPPPVGLINHKILTFSLPLAGKFILMTLETQLALILIGIYLGMAQVAYYNIALLTILVITGTLAQISTALLPTISEEWVQGHKETIAELYNLTIRLSLVILGLIITAVIALPEFILKLISPAYIEAASTLQILGVYAFLMGIMLPSITLLTGTEKPKLVLATSTIVASISIPAILFLIPYLSITGAAIALALATLIGTIAAVIFVKTRLQMQPSINSVVKPTLCITITLTALTLTHHVIRNPIMTIAILAIVYLATVKISNAITKNEIKLLLNLAKCMV